MSSALTSQRFCLRWNNHQSNLLTVFDQLLHDESFVDVTLAVEGRFLRAHKMVLSACSPYFQALFVGHPDKHPIVILKDVPYCDMRSLLDFMYRGEVSVDQERLTAFLKVAESLRIKGLTEVNEDRCDLPNITSSLLSTAAHTPPPVPPPPPHLHRIHPAGHKRSAPPSAANPLLGSALTAPKRKRGRPRKLSGSSPGPGAPPSLLPATPAPAATALPAALVGAVDGVQGARAAPVLPTDANDLDAGRLGALAGESIVVQGSPEMLEVKMGTLDFHQNSPPPAPVASNTQSGGRGGLPPRADAENGQVSPELPRGSTGKDVLTQKIKEEPEPTPGPSSQDPGQTFSQSASEQEQQAFAMVTTVDDSASAISCEDGDYCSLPEDENELITLSPASDVDLDEIEETFKEDELETSSNLSFKGDYWQKKLAQDYNAGMQNVSRILVEDSSSDWLDKLNEQDKTIKEEKTTKTAMVVEEENDEQKEEEEEIASQMSSTRSFCMREADNLFRCKVCQKTYTHISNFCRHYLTTHKQRRQIYGCPECGKEFTRRDNMMTHLKGVHRHVVM